MQIESSRQFSLENNSLNGKKEIQQPQKEEHTIPKAELTIPKAELTISDEKVSKVAKEDLIAKAVLQKHIENIEKKLKIFDENFSLSAFASLKLDEVIEIVSIKTIIIACNLAVTDKTNFSQIQSLISGISQALQSSFRSKLPELSLHVFNKFTKKAPLCGDWDHLTSSVQSVSFILKKDKLLSLPLNHFLEQNAESKVSKHQLFYQILKLQSELSLSLKPYIKDIGDWLKDSFSQFNKKFSSVSKIVACKQIEGEEISFEILKTIRHWSTQMLNTEFTNLKQFSSILKEIEKKQACDEAIIHKFDHLSLQNFDQLHVLKEIIKEISDFQNQFLLAIDPGSLMETRMLYKEVFVEEKDCEYCIFSSLVKAIPAENQTESSDSSFMIPAPVKIFDFFIKLLSSAINKKSTPTQKEEETKKFLTNTPLWFHDFFKRFLKAHEEAIESFRFRKSKLNNYKYFNLPDDNGSYEEIIELLTKARDFISTEKNETVNPLEPQSYLNELKDSISLFMASHFPKLAISNDRYKEILNERKEKKAAWFSKKGVDIDKVFHSISTLNEVRMRMTAIEHCIYLCNLHLNPLIKKSRESFLIKPLSEEEKINVNLWGIEGEQEIRRLDPFKPKSRFTPATKNFDQSKKYNSPKKSQALPKPHIVTPPPPLIPVLSTISDRLAEGKILSPEEVAKASYVSQEFIFALDSKYHLDHATWALELMFKSIEKCPQNWELTLPSLLLHLYDALEQALTPLYLQKFPESEVKHGLCELSKALGYPENKHVDKVTFWFRYPNFNAQAYAREDMPGALKMILKVVQESSGDKSKISQNLFSLIESSKLTSIIKDSISTIVKASLKNDAKLSVFNKWMDELEKNQFSVISSDDTQITALPEETCKILNDVKSLLLFQQDLTNKVDKTMLSQNAQALILDFNIYLKRFSTLIDLVIQFPEQRYISYQTHHLQMTLQYMVEVAASFVLADSRDFMQTHDLKDYVKMLNWNLCQNSVNLIDKINNGKAIEYPFWKSFQSKHTASNLAPLSQAYKLSLYANQIGEGTFPSDMNENNLKNLLDQLLEKIEMGGVLAKELTALILNLK